MDLNDQHHLRELTWVGSDHDAIGVMGAEYFKNMGLRHFAYCGFSNELWSHSRKQGFGRTLAGCTSSFHLWDSPWKDRSPGYWSKDIQKIRHWIENLPKPIGIMAANDIRALHVIEACNQSGVVIPEQVAVLGVDDEEIFCDLSSPRLSSIRPDCAKIGFQAAELLDQMMSGSERTTKRIAIQPEGIIARPSTDITAVSDELVVKAIKKFRRKDGRRCDINTVTKELNISRARLEKRFAKALNRSAADIRRWVMILRIQQLLVDTDLTLTEIATINGLVNSESLNVMFKTNVGVSAGTYRINQANRRVLRPSFSGKK